MATALTLHTQPQAPLEAECIAPQHLAGLSLSNIEKLELMHGNRKVKLGDFFKVGGDGGTELQLEGDLSLVKLVGTGMSEGKITIEGNVGMHLGCGMSGGEIAVNGNANDWVGPEMSGGRITIKGNAGHMVGSAYRGQAVGISGGEILIHGSVKNELGGSMRRGLIAVGGDAGDFAGVNMIAGTLIILGRLGIRSGAGMKRGSIVCFNEADILPTFKHICTYHPLFLRIYLLHLRALGFPIEDKYLHGRYERWCGDGIELNRGEILLFHK